MRKITLLLGLATTLVATAALARPVIADEIGEFYIYFDAEGRVVGRSSMDCEGNYYESGVLTNRYSRGQAFCMPR
ncbi:DUF6289 family protein [Sorangium sp. So ce1036]|uniref:DUF6289 family protein n=1 Tax=Sorangium sp. So ce1036 TaxID=3133328 RepID=UPI003F09EB6D